MVHTRSLLPTDRSRGFLLHQRTRRMHEYGLRRRHRLGSRCGVRVRSAGGASGRTDSWAPCRSISTGTRSMRATSRRPCPEGIASARSAHCQWIRLSGRVSEYAGVRGLIVARCDTTALLR